MKTLRHLSTRARILSLCALLTILTAGLPSAYAQSDQMGALQRGYRTGYSDGYQAGWKDSLDRSTSGYGSKVEYQRADRAYVPAYGSLEDYRDGYRQGFEVGYDTGFERRGFDSTVPADLTRRGVVDDDAAISVGGVGSRTEVYIPVDTTMLVELLTNLSTEASQQGDRFQARVLEPIQYEGAIIDGRVIRVQRPGRVKGRAELQLAFEQIRLPDNRWANINAQLIEVVFARSTSGEVDPEGGVRGRDTTRDDVTKIGAGTAVGAVLGAILGGGKGAAIGAVIGGGVGTGGVLASRGKEIHLPKGQELRIRTNRDTRIP